MKEEIKDKIITIAVFVTVIIVTVFIIQLIGVGVDFLRKRWDLNNMQTPEKTKTQESTTTSEVATKMPPKQLSDMEKYNSYQQLKIYPDGLVTPSDYITNAANTLKRAGRKIKIIGQISDAYIYIKAGANDKNGKFTSIINSYDGIWFYLTNGQFLGGQLDLSRSIYGEPSELTQLLYNFKSIPVAKNKDDYRKGIYRVKNFLPELKNLRTIGSMVSTQRYGKINELIIGYKCADKNDCTITLE